MHRVDSAALSMEANDLEQVLGTLREQALELEAQYSDQAAEALGRLEADRPNLLHFIAALTETRGIMRAEVARLQEVIAGARSARPTVSGGATTGFNVIQSKAGPDGKPLTDEALAVERGRLAEALQRLDENIGTARRDVQQLTRPDERELCESRLIILQDTRRMYQDEMDMMDIELLGRERQARLAAERAAAETSGRAELARVQASLQATEQKLDIAKKRLYFPAVKGFGMAFGSNGIYVGGKDTFISELSGNWAVHGELAGVSITGAPGPLGRITVELGSAPPASLAKAGSVGSINSYGAARTASAKRANNSPKQTPNPRRMSSSADRLDSPLKANTSITTAQSQRLPQQPDTQRSYPSPGSDTGPSEPSPHPSPDRSPTASAAASFSVQPSLPPQQSARSSQRPTPPEPGGINSTAAAHSNGTAVTPSGGGVAARIAALEGATSLRRQSLDDVPELASQLDAARIASHAAAGPSGQGPAAQPAGPPGAVIMGLPPRDPRSRSKNMAMKMINKIGSKSFNKKQSVAPKFPGDTQSDDGMKGRSLASRLLTKKGEKRGEQLSFGGHAQSSQRGRGSSLPTFDLDETSSSAYAARQQSLPMPSPLPFAPQAAAESSVELSRQSTDDLEALQNGGLKADAVIDDDEELADMVPDSAADTFSPAVADTWDGNSSFGANSDRGSDGIGGSTMGTSRRGMFAVLRIEDLGIIGEKGTKVPNMTIPEINIELEFQMKFTYEFTSAAGAWEAPKKATCEILFLDRTVRGNSVPLPKTLIRMLLNATLPKIFQRKVLRWLPPELGQYVLDAGRPFSLAGEIALIGPALSALDADVSYQAGPVQKAKDYKRAAQHSAAAQEARGMLGLSVEQAGALAELFAGQWSLLPGQRRANACDLIKFVKRYSADTALWEQLCVIWDTAFRMLCKYRGLQEPLQFREFMEVQVGTLARKPVRARFAVHKLDLPVNCDAALLAARDYFERVTREYHTKGPDGRDRSQDVQAQQSLAVQLQALSEWEHYMFGRLKVFKSRFRTATFSLVGGADTEQFSVGAENVHYEGPLQIQLQVKTPVVESDGGFSFWIPLPSAKGPVRAFLDRIRGVLTMPLPPYFAPHLHRIIGTTPESNVNEAMEAAAAAVEREGKSVLDALKDLHTHFGAGAAAGGAAANVVEGPPRLGKVLVNRMRVRFRLNEQRVAEMLRGIDPESLGSNFVTVTAGLLGCIGDIASLKFMPVFEEDGSGGQYMLCLESSDVSAVSADLQALGFQSGAGINPGRMIRVVHTVVRSFATIVREADEAAVAAIDNFFEQVYRYTVRKALDVSLAAAASACVEEHSGTVGLAQLFFKLSNLADDGETWPLALTNDIDLVTIWRAISAGPDKF